MADHEMLLAIDNLRKKKLLEDEESKSNKVDINLNITINGRDIQGQQVIPSPSA